MNNIKFAIEEFKKGNFVIIMDNEDRENEGDLVIAAQYINKEKMAFLIKNTSGIICTPITQKKANKLGLHYMTINNTDRNQTNFTVSCDIIEGTTTGVSAEDRALTCLGLADNNKTKSDFTLPGHIFPLVAKDNCLDDRQGHTEATIEMCRFANLPDIGILGELMNDNGTMMRFNDCLKLAQDKSIPIITINEMIQYKNLLNIIPKKITRKVELKAETDLNINVHNENMLVKFKVFWSSLDNNEQVVIVYGDIDKEIIPVRIHSECFTGNIFHSQHCDCWEQLQLGLKIIKEKGYGIFFYLNGHEGRGIGLINKIKAYSLQNSGLDTIEANIKLDLPVDSRNYDSAIEILKYLNVNKIDLITNNPKKCDSLKDLLNKRIDASCSLNKFNKRYLITKKEKMNHKLNLNNLNKRDITLEKFDEYTTLLKTKKIAIIGTNWNKEIIDLLSDKYSEYLQEYGIKKENIIKFNVPGAFELPFQAKIVAKNENIDCIICIGAVIKGETPHFEYISQAVSHAIMKLQMDIYIPIIYGVLSCYNYQQAYDRAYGKKALQKGWAYSTIRMIINNSK
jgi:3,4-dihydroxy 2-butanone 4-phosphate synthase / GTP cyclohydrolase II